MSFSNNCRTLIRRRKLNSALTNEYTPGVLRADEPLKLVVEISEGKKNDFFHRN